MKNVKLGYFLKHALFAFITVVITVHAFVFFSLYVVNGLDVAAINAQGGVMSFGAFLPVWGIILIEFAFAYTLEMCLGSPLSVRLAARVFERGKTHPVLYECAIICATVAIMCPSMSFIAACIYYPYQFAEFNFLTLLANWLKLVCFNFPFALLSQLFFIQPLVRQIFKWLFPAKKRISAEKSESPNEDFRD